eukprot:scaffold24680_cov25-Phaeocystis_antarctica.AAC.1
MAGGFGEGGANGKGGGSGGLHAAGHLFRTATRQSGCFRFRSLGQSLAAVKGVLEEMVVVATERRRRLRSRRRTPSSKADGLRAALGSSGRVGVEVDGWRHIGAPGKTTTRITSVVIEGGSTS